MKIILAHENTKTTVIENPTDNERITWIVLEKDSGEKVIFFPQTPKHPAPCIHVIKLASKKNIDFDDIIWVEHELFNKWFKEERFTEGPNREVPSNDPRIPGIFTMGYLWQVWGIIGDKLYYSAYPRKEE